MEGFGNALAERDAGRFIGGLITALVFGLGFGGVIGWYIHTFPECPKCEVPAVTALSVDWESWPEDTSSASMTKGVLYVPAAGMKIASPAEYCQLQGMVLRCELDSGSVLCLEKTDKVAAIKPEVQARNDEAACKAMEPWAADCVKIFSLMAKMSPPAVKYSLIRTKRMFR